MAGAANANANATIDGGSATNDPPQKHVRWLDRYLDRICMPLIEWTCVAGLPTLLCIHIVGSWPAWLSTEANDDVASSIANGCGIADNDDSLQISLLALVITSIISLSTILIFGDIQDNGSNDHKRGMGVVMGSHLIPIFYLALQIYLKDEIVLDDISMGSCTTTMKEGNEKIQHIRLKGSKHLAFASLGGLAFAFSCLWSQYNHRKYKCRRQNTGQSGDASYDESEYNKDLQSNYSAGADQRSCSAMDMCWKVYILLIILQSSISAVWSNYDISTHLLGILHLTLVLCYKRRPIILNQGSNKSQGVWQDAFTPGEWIAVSTLITSLVGEYILQYAGTLQNSKAEEASSLYKSTSLHLVVAHAGLVGCLVGVAFCSFVKTAMPKSVQQHCANGIGDKVLSYCGIVLHLVAVAGITFGCLDVALRSRLNITGGYCAGFNLPTPMICNDWVPLSIHWLLHFLSCRLDAASVHGGSYTIPRVAVLGYWACVLAVSLHLASMLTTWIASGDEASKKRVIVARKYFHLVAILLFVPVTWIDPDMMALSYAIAITLLLVLEMVRVGVFNNGDHGRIGTVDKATSSPWNQFYMIFLDEKDSSAAAGGLAITHIALLVGCAFPLWTSQLIHACMPNADQLSALSSSGTAFHSCQVLMWLLPFLGVFLLGIGDSAGAICGIMAGRHRWPGGSSRTLEGSLCMFVSLMITVNAGTTKQYLVDREIMKDVSCYTHLTFPNVLLGSIMGTMTLIEATTAQIDNLCLPIAGSTMVLLVAALSR